MSGWALREAGVGPLGAVLVFLAALALALVVHALSKRKRAEARPQPADAELAASLTAIAARMGLAERVLPATRPPSGEGAFLWREGGQLHYRVLERGAPIAACDGPTDDDVLYACFRDLAWSAAYRDTMGMDEAQRSAAFIAEQRRLLAAAEPAWGERFVREAAEGPPVGTA